MPPDATPAAQADAFVALLDALGIDQIDVIGVSAGATSALQLALRHPERVKHLAVLVSNLPGSPTAVVQPSLARLFNRQLPLWVLRTFAPSTGCATHVRRSSVSPKRRAATESSARAGRRKVLLNLCERDHHHHWIVRTLVESGTCVEAFRIVRHRMKQHRANARDLSGR
jgi:pimeloyl-ACP methyl ester carboxylesterase